jgi:hypothetical protein
MHNFLLFGKSEVKMICYTFWIALFALFISLTGCATAPKEKISVAPQPVEEKIIWCQPEKRPDWLEKEPYKEKENLLFIGISDKLATEKDARDNALRAAISRVVGFIGIDVKDKFERLQTSYGLSTDIIDPAIATRRFEEQFSEAVARRVKAKEWYIEKYEVKYKRQPPGTYYLVYVLAFVPEAEINREISSQLGYQEELSKTAKSANDELVRANALIVDADGIAASQPVRAFANYHEATRLVELSKSEVQQYPEIKGIIERADAIASLAKEKQDELLKDPMVCLTVAIYSLAKNAPDKPLTVAVAKVGYQDTELASRFSEYMIQEIEEKLTGASELYKVVPQRTFRDELSRNRISIGDFLSRKIEIGLLGEIKGMVFGQYWDRGDSIELKMELLETGGMGAKIGSETVDLPKDMFPENIEFIPNSTSLQGWDIFGSAKQNREFNVKVWPDKGEGAIYKENEVVQFLFRTNKDCYVYLYHMDSVGQVRLLFPNRYQASNRVNANKTYTIPDETMNFEFQISPPFGSEIVKAVASLQPIEDIEISTGNKDFRDVGIIGDKRIRALVRAIDIIPKQSRSESTTVITTIER